MSWGSWNGPTARRSSRPSGDYSFASYQLSAIGYQLTLTARRHPERSAEGARVPSEAGRMRDLACGHRSPSGHEYFTVDPSCTRYAGTRLRSRGMTLLRHPQLPRQTGLAGCEVESASGGEYVEVHAGRA
jgi:hypothetical protein